MRKFLMFGGLLVSAAAFSAELPEAWRPAVSSNEAVRAAIDYANGSTRCVWAGDVKDAALRMPANVAFQFAVAGGEASVSNVQRTLNAAVGAIPADLRERLRAAHLLAPTLQWMVRSTLNDATNSSAYLKPASHPAAFRESDLNATNLLRLAAKLTPSAIPPVVTVFPQGEFSRRLAAPPAAPGLDYPGIQPELTYATGFGVGMILRAPQPVRTFRFRAAPWPNPQLKVKYAWVPISSSVRGIYGWPGRGMSPQDGYAAFSVDTRRIPRNGRIDVAVFARVEGGFWGPPAVISFCVSPYEARSFTKDNKVAQIKYLPAVKDALPYDLSAVFLPADWTDRYQYDDKRNVFCFRRTRPGATVEQEFSNLGELVLEHHPSDTPKVTEKVRYFVRDGQLRCEPTGERVTYPLASFAPRRRGE